MAWSYPDANFTYYAIHFFETYMYNSLAIEQKNITEK